MPNRNHFGTGNNILGTLVHTLKSKLRPDDGQKGHVADVPYGQGKHVPSTSMLERTDETWIEIEPGIHRHVFGNASVVLRVLKNGNYMATYLYHYGPALYSKQCRFGSPDIGAAKATALGTAMEDVLDYIDELTLIKKHLDLAINPPKRPLAPSETDKTIIWSNADVTIPERIREWRLAHLNDPSEYTDVQVANRLLEENAEWLDRVRDVLPKETINILLHVVTRRGTVVKERYEVVRDVLPEDVIIRMGDHVSYYKQEDDIVAVDVKDRQIARYVFMEIVNTEDLDGLRTMLNDSNVQHDRKRQALEQFTRPMGRYF